MSIDDHPRRRADDRLDPVVETFVEKRLTETRHELRAEFSALVLNIERKLTEMQAQIAQAALQSTKEHAENRAYMEMVSAKVAEIPELVKRVSVLERHEEVDDARRATRDELVSKVASARRWAIGICVALLAIAVPQVVGLINHT